MTQTATFRSNFRMLPGHIYTPNVPGREPESCYAPFTMQQFTFTVAGTDPTVAGDYTISFATPANGTIVVTYTNAGGGTPTALATALAAAINANPVVAQLYTATSNAAVVTLIAKSANTSLAVPITAVPGGTTVTAAQSVASAANALRMGLWYVYSSVVQPYAISGTPRGAHRIALPGGSTTIPDLRGVIARVTNQTQLSATFQDNLTYDAYPAGSIFPGCLRGEVCTVIDPASGPMSPGSQVHVVIAAGTYSVIGSVAAAADGGNTLRLDNTSGVVRARVTAIEETLSLGLIQRLAVLEVNQTN